MKMKGRIVEIDKKVHRISYLTQGIKKEKQPFYDTAFNGGIGSYITGGEYLGTSLDVKIFVYDLERCIKFDIRDYVLQQNGKSKISKKILDHIKQNRGKKVSLKMSDDTIVFDMSQLDVIP